ncbi:MAG: response regulator [Ruminococcus sp.]|nr:response regulator [Ruminococcus sp.]
MNILKKNRRVFAGARLLSVAVCLALLLSATLPVLAFAQPIRSKTVRVGYYENEVFQEGAKSGSVKTGYAYEYYLKIAEYTGWRYEYVYGSFADLYQKLLDGEIDFLAGLAYKEERDGLIAYPEKRMGHETYNLIKHAPDVGITADPATQNGLTFGVLNSAVEGVLESYLYSNGIDATVKVFDDYDPLFTAFDQNQINILAAEDDGVYSRNRAEVLCSFGECDYYLCVNINREDLLAELNTAQRLLESEEPNYLNTLNNKYYPVKISSRTFSEPEREWLDEHDSLTVGYLTNFLPYSDADQDGKVSGMVSDLMPALLRKLSIPELSVSYQGYDNYDEMIADMGEGVIDVAFPVGGGLYYCEENGIYQSQPVTTILTDLVYLGEYDGNTEKSVAVNENNRMQYYYVRAAFPKAEIKYYPTIDDCLNAVLTGEVGCTVLNGIRSLEYLKNSKYKKLSLRQLPYSDDKGFGVEIGNEGLLKLINRGIGILGAEYFQNLAYRYTEGLYHYTFTDMLRDYMPLFVVLIIGIAALIIFFLIRNAIRKRNELCNQEKSRLELEEKNKELAESQKALSDALIAAENANRAKTAFLNNMSHDIRTPMNAIVGFTAMAATHIDNKQQVQDYLSKISVSSRHLLSLINDVLDMSRIESGKMKIDETEIHLPDLIHDLRTIIQSNVKAKQLELFIDTQDVKNEDIVADKLRLSQVLLNILTNAVKFTPSGGTISFRVIEKPCDAAGMTAFEFRIKDNGIGMSEEFLETIFEAFSRERNTTVSGIQGTGLGMAIAKNIVDLMGGKISVTSQVGKGSEFVVDIPCKIAGGQSDSFDLEKLRGLRALVADDDTNSCLSICSMLRDIGMHPDWTNYGKEAVIRAKEAFDQGDKFRVYIIDWLMPDLNGIETVRRIRSVIGDDDPIIVLTAYDWSDIEIEAREAGVTGFVSKPLFMSELKSALAEPFHMIAAQEEQEDEKFDFSGRRILLAEDNELNSMIAVSILEGVGFSVDVAENGEEAVRMVKDADEGCYDAVLMDIQMPVMDGYEAAGLIRLLDDKKKANIPIIAVTANAFEEDRKEALQAGMNGHLAKPYDIPEMLKLLNEVLQS